MKSRESKKGLLFFIAAGVFCVWLLVYKWPHKIKNIDFAQDDIMYIEVYKPLPYQYQRTADITILEKDEIEKWWFLFSECRFSYCGSRSKYFYPDTEEAVFFCLKSGEIWDVYRVNESRIVTPNGCYEVYGKDSDRLKMFWSIMDCS
ncbi:MAG: hypothetical protein HFI93_02190 [Lachnospiraceae bacterium]|nr:hypothetical protein [Lachnospiraceae bacterium]